MSYMEPQERVANSIELLDEVAGKLDFVPVNWRERLDLDSLNMDSCTWCILGQLWKAETSEHDGYSPAMDAIDRITDRNPYGPDYEFTDAKNEWIRQLKKSSTPMPAGKFAVGQTWLCSSRCCNRTIKSITEIDGKTWLMFTSDDGNVDIMDSEYIDIWSLKPKVRFTKGQYLKHKNWTELAKETSYIYISEEKVIRIMNNKMSWCSLAWYEKDGGELIIDESRSTADFYFNMWNES